MLVILNLVIIVFLLGMIAMWSTYGFYSALLNLIVVVSAGVIALAFWEPTTFWLLGRMPAYAHGVGLLGPFALALIILRGVVDRLCRMNVHVPRLADQIGGGAIGLISGILAIGMFLNGANFLPLARDAFGWEPYSIQKAKLVESVEGGLWLDVNEWSGSFFTMLSSGSMSPIGGPSISEARPELAKRAIAFRMPEDSNQARSAHPDNVQVTGLYAVPANEAAIRALVDRATLLNFLSPGYELPKDIDFGADGMGLVNSIYADFNNRHADPEKFGNPSQMLNIEQILAVSTSERFRFSNPTNKDNFKQFVSFVSNQLGSDLVSNIQSSFNDNAVLVLVDTRWESLKAGTYDSDSKLRLGITQVRLQTSTDRGLQMVEPMGFSVQYSQNSGARTFSQLVTAQHFAAYSPFPKFNLGLAFIVPSNAELERLFIRELRFDLNDLPNVQGQENAVNQNFGAASLAMGVPVIDTAKKDDPNTGTIRLAKGAVKILGTESYAELNERLPSSFSNSGTGFEADRDADPFELISGAKDKMPRGSGGKRSTIRQINVSPSDRLVRIAMDNKKAKSLLGQALGAAASLSVMHVRDQGGNDYQAIGWAMLHNDGSMSLDVRKTGVGRGLSVKDLPTVRAGEDLYVYFQVPMGKKLTSFVIVNEVRKFEEPLEVTGSK